jgi:hypothetical protein
MDALDVYNEYLNKVEPNNSNTNSDYTEYRNLLVNRFDKDGNFDVATAVHLVSKRLKFTFYDNGIVKYEFLYFKDISDDDKKKFLNLMNFNEKKIKDLEKRGEAVIKINHMFLCAYYFLCTLSAYFIEKNQDMEKSEFVSNFELNFKKLINDPMFNKYCSKFDKNAKDNHYNLFD